MGMGIDDKTGNWNRKEWETTCMEMGMALIPMEITSHRRLVLMTSLFCTEKKQLVKVEYYWTYFL